MEQAYTLVVLVLFWCCFGTLPPLSLRAGQELMFHVFCDTILSDKPGIGCRHGIETACVCIRFAERFMKKQSGYREEANLPHRTAELFGES